MHEPRDNLGAIQVIQTRWQSAVFSLVFLLAGCANVEVGWDIDRGRRYLMMREPQRALVEFQKIAELEPDYDITSFGTFPESIWTYIGRAYYDLGQLGPARMALERSVKEGSAIFGYIYLGLVQMRQGEPDQGLQNALIGLRRLQGWFQKLEATDGFARYWDRRRIVRSETARLIARIEAGNVRWQQIAPELAGLGDQMDEVINVAAALREQAIDMSLHYATE